MDISKNSGIFIRAYYRIVTSAILLIVVWWFLVYFSFTGTFLFTLVIIACLVSIGSIYFVSTSIVIRNGALKKKELFGLASQELSLNDLARVDMFNMYGRYSNDYKIILTDKSGSRLKLRVNYTFPKWHMQDSLLVLLDQSVRNSGAQYNNLAASKLKRSTVKGFS